MIQNIGLFRGIGLLILLVGALGCGGSASDLTEVSGQVLLDGKPLATGSVITMPEHGRGANGKIDNEGRFALTSGEAGPGASIGLHHVAVVAVEESATFNPEAPRKSLIPQKYASAETSGLTIDVKPGETMDVVLELSSGD